MDVWEDKYGTPLEEGCSVWVELEGGYLLEDIVKFGISETRFDGAKVWTELEGIARHRNEHQTMLTRLVVRKD